MPKKSMSLYSPKGTIKLHIIRWDEGVGVVHSTPSCDQGAKAKSPYSGTDLSNHVLHSYLGLCPQRTPACCPFPPSVGNFSSWCAPLTRSLVRSDLLCGRRGSGREYSTRQFTWGSFSGSQLWFWTSGHFVHWPDILWVEEGPSWLQVRRTMWDFLVKGPRRDNPNLQGDWQGNTSK